MTKALQASGFISKGGSKHEAWVHPDGRRTLVGRHKDIPSPTARMIANRCASLKVTLPASDHVHAVTWDMQGP
jgi:predicted RNA binding protein YcfA (HicA-like mRNA interferase family)